MQQEWIRNAAIYFQNISFLSAFTSVLWDLTKNKKFTVNKKKCRMSEFRGQNRNQGIKLKNQQHMFTVTFTPCRLHLATCFHPSHILCLLCWCIVGRTFMSVWSTPGRLREKYLHTQHSLHPNTHHLNRFSADNYTQLCLELHHLFIYFYFQYFDMIFYRFQCGCSRNSPCFFPPSFCFDCVFNCFEQSVLAFEKCAVKV